MNLHSIIPKIPIPKAQSQIINTKLLNSKNNNSFYLIILNSNSLKQKISKWKNHQFKQKISKWENHQLNPNLIKSNLLLLRNAVWPLFPKLILSRLSTLLSQNPSDEGISRWRSTIRLTLRCHLQQLLVGNSIELGRERQEGMRSVIDPQQESGLRLVRLLSIVLSLRFREGRWFMGWWLYFTITQGHFSLCLILTLWFMQYICTSDLRSASIPSYGLFSDYLIIYSITLFPAAFPLTPPSTLALLLPNCIALLTLLAVPFSPALSAAILNNNLSPHPSPDS